MATTECSVADKSASVARGNARFHSARSRRPAARRATFGSLTGGLDASHPEILKQVGGNATALVPLNERMLRFRIAA